MNVRMQQFFFLTMCRKLTDVLFVAHVKRWLHEGKGLMASKSVSVVFIFFERLLRPYEKSGCDAGIKMRPTNEELSSMSPEFNQRWNNYFANAPDKPVMVVLPFSR